MKDSRRLLGAQQPDAAVDVLLHPQRRRVHRTSQVQRSRPDGVAGVGVASGGAAVPFGVGARGGAPGTGVGAGSVPGGIGAMGGGAVRRGPSPVTQLGQSPLETGVPITGPPTIGPSWIAGRQRGRNPRRVKRPGRQQQSQPHGSQLRQPERKARPATAAHRARRLGFIVRFLWRIPSRTGALDRRRDEDSGPAFFAGLPGPLTPQSCATRVGRQPTSGNDADPRDFSRGSVVHGRQARQGGCDPNPRKGGSGEPSRT
jgi:hypothetical protein